jgi:hypothetical protein
MKKIIIIIAFILGFMGMHYIKEENNEYKKVTTIKKVYKETEDKINNELKKDTSNKTNSEKRSNAIKEMVSERLQEIEPTSVNNEDKVFSAGLFAGQYMKQTKILYDYCNNLGVKVSDFSDKYKKEHKELYIISNNILIKNGSSIEELYRNGKDYIMKNVKNEVKDIRDEIRKNTSDNSVSLKDVCDFHNYISTDEVLFNNVKFSKVMPEAYKILIEL